MFNILKSVQKSCCNAENKKCHCEPQAWQSHKANTVCNKESETPLTAVGTLTSLLRNSTKVMDYLSQNIPLSKMLKVSLITLFLNFSFVTTGMTALCETGSGFYCYYSCYYTVCTNRNPVDCPAGYYCPANDRDMHPCPANTYNRYTRSDSCISCAGYAYSGTGATSCTYLNCTTSQYAADHTCNPCPAGYASNGGTSTSCPNCASGYHKNGINCEKDCGVVNCSAVSVPSNATCTSSCTSRTTTCVTSSVCTAWSCNSGFTKSGNECIKVCGQGQKRSGTSCVACDDGTYQSSTSHTNTSCSANTAANCATYSKTANVCASCATKFKFADNKCVMMTCAEVYEGSSETQCETTTNGCSVTTCSEVGSLADGTKCYKSATVNHTPSCDTNASIVGEGASCACQCNNGYKGNGTTCEMLTCAEVYEGSSETQCESSVSGCSVTTCSEVGSLANGTKCYKSATVNHTPSCDTNASIVGEGASCACQCNNGYKGNGTTCEMLTCAEVYEGSSEMQCESSVTGCSVTTCNEVGALANGTKCYKSTTTDHTPDCDSNATLIGEGAECACVCNTGFEGSGTTCTAISCPAGKYLDGSECKSCAAGSYSGAGDNVCSQCGAHEYSAAGASSCSPRNNMSNCSSFATDSDECTGCNTGYKQENGGCVSICNGGKVFWDGECYDEYPFAKKRYTPAEADPWLKDNGNVVTLIFKK